MKNGPMSLQDLRDREREIVASAYSKKRALHTRYALSHSPAQTGDLVADHRCTIQVVSMRLYFNTENVPAIIYEGPRRLANGGECRRPKTELVYQYNLKKINGVPYTPGTEF